MSERTISGPNYAGTGIPLSTGFDLYASEPLDHREIKSTYHDMESIPDIERYEGMCVFVLQEQTQYRLASDGTWVPDSFSFLSGKGDPNPNDGNLGYMYLNTDSGDVFKMIKGENGQPIWEIQFSLVGMGEKGDPGKDGTRGSVWWYGTKIVGGTLVVDKIFTDSGITAAMEKDIYFNTSSSDIYQCTLSGGSAQAKWSYIGNIRGAKGDKGDSSRFYTGTAITGTSTTPTSFQTGIASAKVDEIYINTYYGTVYQCTVAGNQTTAKWIYTSSLKFNEVAIQDTEPTEDDVKIWIKPNSTDTNNIVPYIRDDFISDEDTYSSEKINEIIGGKWYFGTVNGTLAPQSAYYNENDTLCKINDPQLGYVRIGDVYFHKNNFTVYQCVQAANPNDPSSALWVIKTNLMNPVLQVIKDQGYMKAVSVTELPSTPEQDTIYFIQGEVTIV